jgi:N-acetylglutamate synthase-like GNAT family acetyltransferase
MRELGVDLSAGQPQKLSDALAASATMLVTMGCGEACPVVPGAIRDDWPLEDPKGKTLERVREIRAEIEARVQDLLLARAWLPWTVRDARPDARLAAEDLLRAAELPTQGVADHFANFTVAVDAQSRLAGVAGLELYGTSALLRSVVVRTGAELRGLGSILTRRTLERARGAGAADVYLLTTSAEAFFARRGVERVARSAVSPAVARSAEFNGACPSSATVMHCRP